MDAMLERERAVIEAGVRELTAPVTIQSYTSDVESWYSHTERLLLEKIAAASPHVTLEMLVGDWDHVREEAVGIARTPAIKLAGTRAYDIVWYGQPDGYELETFMANVRCAAHGRSELTPRSVAELGAVKDPIHLEVLISST